MTVDCMACLVAASRMYAADPGLDIILEGITHSAYVDIYGDERLTCQYDRPIGFRSLWLDAVTRAARGLRPRPALPPNLRWMSFKFSSLLKPVFSGYGSVFR